MAIIEEKPEKEINFSAFKKIPKGQKKPKTKKFVLQETHITEEMYESPDRAEQHLKKLQEIRQGLTIYQPENSKNLVGRPSSCKPKKHQKSEKQSKDKYTISPGDDYEDFEVLDDQFTPPNYENEARN